MILAVDLNALPVPEEDEDSIEGHVQEFSAPQEPIETALDIVQVLFSLCLCIFHSFDNDALDYLGGSLSFISMVQVKLLTSRIFIGFVSVFHFHLMGYLLSSLTGFGYIKSYIFFCKAVCKF